MLTDFDIDLSLDESRAKGLENGNVPMALVIDGRVVIDIAAKRELAELLVDEIIRKDGGISENNLYIVNFIKNGQIIESLETSEKMWAVLLSNPEIVYLTRDKIGFGFYEPGCRYIDGKFYPK